LIQSAHLGSLKKDVSIPARPRRSAYAFDKMKVRASFLGAQCNRMRVIRRDVQALCIPLIDWWYRLGSFGHLIWCIRQAFNLHTWLSYAHTVNLIIKRNRSLTLKLTCSWRSSED
jgi:hypothetical protein